MSVVLQMCSPGQGFLDRITAFEFVEALTCQYADPIGMATLALIVYAGVAGSIYIRTDSLIFPFGLLLMTGGAVVGQLAAVSTPVLVLLVLVVPAGMVAYLYYRFNI